MITADLLEALSSIDLVDILPIFLRPPPPGYTRQPPAGMEGVLLGVPGLPRWASVLKAAVLLSSPLRHRFDNKRVGMRVREVLAARRFRPDLIHVEHLPLVDVGLDLARFAGCPLVYRAHNVESRLWARRLGLPPMLRDPIVAHMQRREASAVASADLSLFISSSDLEWARAVAPKARTELLPCTLSLKRYTDVSGIAPVFDLQACFVGGLDWAPNEDGLRWFVLEVLPHITGELQGAGLVVLARGADQRPWIHDHPSVKVLPPGSAAVELFATSHVSIAPLFQGGGVRIKIPESLAVGCPVVATTIGAEGHELQGISIADDPIGFARACMQQMRNPKRAPTKELLRSALEVRYGAALHARRLNALWTETIEACLAPTGHTD